MLREVLGIIVEGFKSVGRALWANPDIRKSLILVGGLLFFMAAFALNGGGAS